MSAEIEQSAGGRGTRHPRAVAILLCERAIADSATGRVSLIGIHGEISAPTFPFTMPECYLYARLTDGSGRYAITLVLSRRRDLTEVATGDVSTMEISDPSVEFEIVAKLRGIPLAEPGFYDLGSWANGRFVHSLSLQARRV